MMKMMILAGRRPGMTIEEFRRYLLEVHAPLVRSVTEVAADIRRYHYNFPENATSADLLGLEAADGIDVVTQGWFDSRAAQLRNMARPAYLARVRPDEGRFANEAKAVMHYTQEILVREGRPSARKLFCFRRRRPDMTRADFQYAWREAMADALSLAPDSTRHLAGYVQNHTMAESDHPDGMNEKYYDVIDEFFISDDSGPASFGADQALIGALRRLENDLTAPGRNRALVTQAVVNIG